MKCERVAEMLPDYLQGGLGHDLDDQIEDHIEQCANCAQEVALWKELAHLPIEQPSPALRSRFQAMLSAYGEGRSEAPAADARVRRSTPSWLTANWLRPAAIGVAGALAMLIIGFFAGRNTAPVNLQPSQPEQQQLAEVRTELKDMRQLVVLSMLQQQSATERLQGVSFSTQDSHADPQVLAALLHTLRYDNSVDVRLAALDALSRHGNQPQVRSGLRDSLPTEQSPLVQVAMIDLLVELHDTGSINQLQKFQSDPKLNPAVRERAAWAIQKLS